MAGIGKLTKLLIKGKKFLNSPAMKKVGAGAKATGNALIWPFKKVHELQDYYPNPYTTGGKIKKAIFAPLWYGAIALPITGLAGILGGLGTGIYGEETGNENLKGAGFALFAKSSDLTCASLGGLILGGPIGGIAAGAYSIFGDKSLFASIIGKLVDKKDGENIETFVNKKRDELFAYIKSELGLTSTTGQAEQEEELSEEAPEKSEITAENNTTTVVPADTTNITLPADTTRIMTPTDSTGIVPADSTLVTPLDSTRVVPPLSSDSTRIVPTDSTLVAASDTTGIVSRDSTKVVNTQLVDEEDDEEEDADDDVQQPPTQQTPPSDNLFNGAIHEITKASVGIVKGDCLWNIAKRELQAANPGETITNAQILKQVKEFGRLNPEMFGENPSLQKLDLIYPDKQLKLCA